MTREMELALSRCKFVAVWDRLESVGQRRSLLRRVPGERRLAMQVVIFARWRSGNALVRVCRNCCVGTGQPVRCSG